MKKSLFLGTGLISALGSFPALAQENPATAPGQGLTDIIVTAQRRPEPLQRAAVAVSVVSSEDIVRAGVTKATDLAALVPALQASSAGGTTASFYVRGVGAFVANSYTDGAVSFNYDGVYLARPASTSGVFYDLGRVEVLKGPQGTLYGRNSTGGAINVLPQRPELGKTSGFVDLSYGNYDALNVQGAINVPLGQITALRIAAMGIDRKGYNSDGTDDDKGWAIRPQLLFQPSDDFSLRIAADYYQQRGKGGGGTFTHAVAFNPANNSYTAIPSGLDSSVGTFDSRAAAFLGTAFSGVSGRTLGPLLSSPRVNNENWGLNAELTWKTGIGTLTVIPSYRQFKQEATTGGGGFTNYTRDSDKQFSLETRLSGDPSARLSWLVGGFYFKDTVDAPDFRVTMQVLDSFQKYKLETESLAAFGRLGFKVTDRFRLVASGRYTNDHRSFAGTANVLLDVCASPTHVCANAPLLPFASSVADTVAQLGLIQVAPPTANSPAVYIQPSAAAANTIFLQGTTTLDQSRTDGRFTYHLGAEYDLAPSSLLYLSYDTGFRSGGFAFSGFRPTFGPENIRAWTLGSKNRFFNNRVQLNVEAFLWKYTDQQVSHLGPDPQLGSTFYTENIGRSTNKGIEVELQVKPAQGTRLFADVQYLETKLDSFKYTSPAVTNGTANPPPYVACGVTPPAAFTAGSNYTIDCSGQSAFQAPQWTINFGGEQNVKIGDYELIARASTHYQSKSFIGFEYLPSQTQSAYWTTNAGLTFQPTGGAWSISAFANNIENKRRGVLSYYNSPTSTVTGINSAPRTYGVRLSYKF
ncbi:TonB-dependent receptor [Novosphingobium sp. SG707]|uniref:TonB-dependent receptor n=1 Tax=Novosphingobium sp. SG707 TaxID=2586996 RepID=UPI0014460BF5|nr:TonB-dependent receptor [Novosphingobium sp. SG707]NKJ02350.1 iron complex outermembrane receptor protein [Novosphingobium sp. SG707]